MESTGGRSQQVTNGDRWGQHICEREMDLYKIIMHMCIKSVSVSVENAWFIKMPALKFAWTFTGVKFSIMVANNY